MALFCAFYAADQVPRPALGYADVALLYTTGFFVWRATEVIVGASAFCASSMK
jgi:hypothetical protein